MGEDASAAITFGCFANREPATEALEAAYPAAMAASLLDAPSLTASTKARCLVVNAINKKPVWGKKSVRAGGGGVLCKTFHGFDPPRGTGVSQPPINTDSHLIDEINEHHARPAPSTDSTAVFALWQGTQRAWRLSSSSEPPRARLTM